MCSSKPTLLIVAGTSIPDIKTRSASAAFDGDNGISVNGVSVNRVSVNGVLGQQNLDARDLDAWHRAHRPAARGRASNGDTLPFGSAE
jgi:hypothetical protein